MGRPWSPGSGAEAQGLPHNPSPDPTCNPTRGQLHNFESLLPLLLLANLRTVEARRAQGMPGERLLVGEAPRDTSAP